MNGQNGTRKAKPTNRLFEDVLDRVLPHDLDAEHGVLGSVILRQETVDDVGLVLTEADFYDEANQRLYGHIAEMHNAGEKIDMTLLFARLKDAGDFERIGGAAHIAHVAGSVPNAAHAVYYAKRVREKAIRRRLIEAHTRGLEAAHDSVDDAASLQAQAEQLIFEVGDTEAATEHTRSAKSVITDALVRLDQRKTHGRIGIPTGFADLDEIIGGLKRGDVYILAGRTSMGKTAAACNIAEHVAIVEGRAVLFVSLEMKSDEIGDRLLASQARVDSWLIQEGRYNKDHVQSLLRAGERVSSAPLYIDDYHTRTVGQIASLARRQKRRERLDVLFVDYLQLIVPDNPRDPRQEQVAQISRRLKGLARELQVPIVCLAQLNRKNEDSTEKRPTLSSLRESGAIEQDADTVLFVHREGYYATNKPEPGHAEVAELIVAKNRKGRTGKVNVNWFGAYCRFDNAGKHEGF